MCFTRSGGDDLLDTGPNPPLSSPPGKEIFHDSLSGNLGPFPTFYVSGLIPGNTQGLCSACNDEGRMPNGLKFFG